MEHLRAQPLPLFAFAIETIDVEHHRFAEQTRDVSKRAVGDIAEEHDVAVAEGDMHCGKKCADPGIEMLLMKTRHDHAAYALVIHIVGSRKCSTAVDRHLVALIGKARADLLGKALKAAIAIGNAASSDDGDFHERSNQKLAISD